VTVGRNSKCGNVVQSVIALNGFVEKDAYCSSAIGSRLAGSGLELSREFDLDEEQSVDKRDLPFACEGDAEVGNYRGYFYFVF
jgi:hypothetical protein